MKNGGYRGFTNLKVVGYFTGVWPDLCNSRIVEIVSDEYSCLELLGLEGLIKFDVLVFEKFAVEHFAIFVFRSVSVAGR